MRGLDRAIKPKILVVDDEQDNLDLLYRTFRREYKVLRSDNGPEALHLLEQEQDDVAVIISDQRMPHMSGTELLSLTAEKYPNTIRIILTGYTDVEDLVDAINQGKVFKYVTKPWNAEELRAIVEQALDTHNLLKIRTKELHRSLRRETLLNSVINTIRNRQYDTEDEYPLKDMLQTIVNTIGEVLEVDLCILRPLGDNGELAPEWFTLQSIDRPFEAMEQTLWQTEQVQVIDDVVKDQTLAGNGTLQEIFISNGIQSSLLVPLNAQNQLLAMLALYRCQDQEPWHADDIHLVKMVADQSALGISQVRAYEQVRALARRESLVNTITRTIRSSLEPEAIFTAITRQLGTALNVDGCALSLWTKHDLYVQCVGLYDRDQGDQSITALPQSRMPISENPVLQELLTTLKPVVVEDMVANQGENNPSKALLIAPLIVDENLLGSISLRDVNSARCWSDHDIELIKAVASQAAIAVQQSRLYETTRQQAEKLREREAKVKQLNKYLTESVLKRFLPEAMVNKAATGELVLDLSPEPRVVTILFSDIVGFTPMSISLGPRKIAELLNEYLDAMTQAVFANGGTVDKFIGDAIVALFGSPEELSPEEQVKRSIAVARAMYASLEKLNQDWQERGLLGKDNMVQEVQFRCGIHQGNVVVGMFGGGRRSDYTAIGPAVNMASRLQEAANPDSILVSEEVAQYLDPEDIVRQQSHQLKGIEGAVNTYMVYASRPSLP
ncbi:MAG: GAF domain-containing protein [Synechococcaceae cyanobacterium RL_1_2]|nr:GAF domain-containing protein [Synechococcaceae cyanobacterium RL_1_2]